MSMLAGKLGSAVTDSCGSKRENFGLVCDVFERKTELNKKMGDHQQRRFEKSLGLLTTKFVDLLQKSTGGVLDLKVVCKTCVCILYTKKISSNFRSGCRFIGCEAKTTNLRHNQRFRRHRAHREKE